MKRPKPILLIALLMVLFQNVFAHVTLLYPVGGETFQEGEVITVQWEIAIYHGACDWDLSFSSDGGSTWEMLAQDLPESQLSYDWTVPNIQTDSARIKITQDNLTWHADYSDSSGNFTINLSTGVKESRNHADVFILYPAFPNPFNPSTQIKFSIPEAMPVRLEIFNMLGERVNVLLNQPMTAGEYTIRWNAVETSSGIYLYQLTAGNRIQSRKMILLR